MAIIFGMIFATLRYHIPFLTSDTIVTPNESFISFSKWLSIALYSLLAVFALFNMVWMLVKEHGIESSDALVAFLIGLMYGGGLMLGSAFRPSVVIGFLTLSTDRWNPTLLILMASIILTNQLVFYLILGKRQPVLEEGMDYQLLSDENVLRPVPAAPKEVPYDVRLVTGSALFGAGWAFGGLCPGTIVSGAFFAYSHAVIWVVGFIFGYWVLRVVDKIMGLPQGSDVEELQVHFDRPPSNYRIDEGDFERVPTDTQQ